MKADLSNAINHLSDKSIQYKIVLPTDGYDQNKTIYYSKDVVYYETKATKQDSAESEPYIQTTGTGYLLKDGKEIPFEVDKDGNVKATSIGTSTSSLSNRYFDWKLSYNVLKKNNDNTYSFKDNVIKIEEAIPTGGYFSLAKYETIKLSLDKNKYISSISYDYEDEDEGLLGNEKVEIKYDEEGSIESSLLAKIKALEEGKAKTNWQEDMPNLYITMTASYYCNFPKEDVDALPYIYIKEISGKWNYFYSDGVLALNSFAFMSDNKNTSYAEEFKKKFEDDPTWVSKQINGVNYYVHGKLKVLVGSTLNDLMKISLDSE